MIDNDSACGRCGGTGWVTVKKKDRELAQRCQCLETDIYITREQNANIPERFMGFELKAYLPQEGNPSQKKAKKILQRFIDDYPVVKDGKGILFQGPVGVGKTRLLCSIANELIKKFPTIDVYYIDWNELVREMKSGEDHSTRDFVSINRLVSRLIAADLLMFDELGASRCSEWVQDNIYHVFNKRYNDKKMTVCASNYLDKNVLNKESLEQRIGDRIRSRLYEMTEAFEIKGNDYRRQYG